MPLIPILKKSHLPSYLEETGYTCMHTCRRWERPKDATSMLPKWALLAQQEIHRAAGRAETRCQGLFIQNNALAVDGLFCQHFSLLTLRLLKSGLAPFFISISTSLSLPLSLLPLPGVNVLRISCCKAHFGSLAAEQSDILMMARNRWRAGGLSFSLLEENSESHFRLKLRWILPPD